MPADRNLAAEIGKKLGKMKPPSKGGTGHEAFDSAAGDSYDAIVGESKNAYTVALKEAIKACLAETKKSDNPGNPGNGEDEKSEEY